MIEKIGTYLAGEIYIDLRIDTKHTGGAYFYIRGGNKIPEITIGFGSKNLSWGQAFEYLIHEITELAAVKFHLRFDFSPQVSLENGSYQFFMDHFQFACMTGFVAEFMVDAIPDFSSAYNRHFKTKRKPRRKNAKRKKNKSSPRSR